MIIKEVGDKIILQDGNNNLVIDKSLEYVKNNLEKYEKILKDIKGGN